VEHALIALALALLAPERTTAAAAALLGLASAAFAVHGAGDQRRLADEAGDGGRPRFEPDVVRESAVTSGLLYFDDDQAFELAHDPRATPAQGLLAVRLRGDDTDRLVYESFGRPPSHRYLVPRAPGATATVPAWSPPGAGEFWRFEAEAGWPPASVSGGQAERFDKVGSCASDGQGLTLTPAAGQTARLVLELPVPGARAASAPLARRTWLISLRTAHLGGPGSGSAAIVLDPGADGERAALARWSWNDAMATGIAVTTPPTCEERPPVTVDLGGDRPRAWLVVTAEGGPVTIDRTLLRPR
jgi:hypothetical protein